MPLIETVLDYKGPILAAFAIIYATAKWLSCGTKKLPPGPKPWPIVGNLLQFDVENPLTTFHQWAKEFGPVYSLYMGSKLNIVINDYETLKKTFSGSVGDIAAGRPYSYIIEKLMDDKLRGVVSTSGDLWKDQRRFSLSTLRDFGFGKSLMEEKIVQQTNVMIEELREQLAMSPDCDVNLALKYGVGNIIASVTFGQTFSRGDREFEAYNSVMDENFRLLPKSQLLNFFPIFRYFGRNYFHYDAIMHNVKIVRAFLQKLISSHLTETPDEITNFVDAYVKEMRLKSSDPDTFYTPTQLEFLTLDLFVAGQETTVTTLTWAVLFLIHNPEIQNKIYAEIVENVAAVPTWNDRTKLPYTNAAIAEVQRISNIVPLGLQHENFAEIEVCGYKIPPQTAIISNLYSIHNDPRVFPQPSKFLPERFLDAFGALDKCKLDSLAPFSVGKRVCLGESLARMELFLILSALVFNFTFEPVDKSNLPSLTPRFGVTLASEPFKVKLIPR